MYTQHLIDLYVITIYIGHRHTLCILISVKKPLNISKYKYKMDVIKASYA